jgi:two-component system alkaline phosphatase synthesis response regulator PhoP
MASRILIVDDEPNIIISLEFLMKREGFEVAVAGDGERALQAMAEQRPDLVILDVMMPRLNGFEVCQRIRAQPAWRGVPVLMLTAKGHETDLKKGLALGADAYVTKPFSTRELVAEIRRLLEARP